MDTNVVSLTGTLSKDVIIQNRNGQRWAEIELLVTTDARTHIIPVRTTYLCEEQDFKLLQAFCRGERVAIEGEIRVHPNGKFYIRARDYERVPL